MSNMSLSYLIACIESNTYDIDMFVYEQQAIVVKGTVKVAVKLFRRVEHVNWEAENEMLDFTKVKVIAYKNS